MKKEEVELIICQVSSNGEDALNMKIYKDGTTCRYGNGGLPRLGISGMSFFESSKYFDHMLNLVPQEILENPINYQEEHPNGQLQYIIAFYGVSKNGETGERADWEKSTGIRLVLDNQTQFRHQILGFTDNFVMEAAQITNDWYFDVIVNSVYKMKSSKLPDQTIITEPKTKEEVAETFSNYVNQIRYSARSWDITKFGIGKSYKNNEGKEHTANVSQNGDNFNFKFDEIGGNNQKEKKSKWKFW